VVKYYFTVTKQVVKVIDKQSYPRQAGSWIILLSLQKTAAGNIFRFPCRRLHINCKCAFSISAHT